MDMMFHSMSGGAGIAVRTRSETGHEKIHHILATCIILLRYVLDYPPFLYWSLLLVFYRHLPLALTLSRFVLAPVLVGLASTSLPGWLLALICITAFLTDLFDGILARRWGVATPQLRRLDVIADIVFYLAMIVAFYLRRPEVIHVYGW